MDDPALAGWSTVFVFGVVFRVGWVVWFAGLLGLTGARRGSRRSGPLGRPTMVWSVPRFLQSGNRVWCG